MKRSPWGDGRREKQAPPFPSLSLCLALWFPSETWESSNDPCNSAPRPIRFEPKAGAFSDRSVPAPGLIPRRHGELLGLQDQLRQPFPRRRLPFRYSIPYFTCLLGLFLNLFVHPSAMAASCEIRALCLSVAIGS
jgi:hypothetical protein